MRFYLKTSKTTTTTKTILSQEGVFRKIFRSLRKKTIGLEGNPEKSHWLVPSCLKASGAGYVCVLYTERVVREVGR